MESFLVHRDAGSSRMKEKSMGEITATITFLSNPLLYYHTGLAGCCFPTFRWSFWKQNATD